MKLFNRHESCVGITLWRFGQLNIELWYCPSGYTIKEHSHPEEDIELYYLFGNSHFFRKSPSGTTEVAVPHIPFKHFTVKAGWSHWFTVSRLPLIFINKATFKREFKPKSASVDFKSSN